MSESRFVSCIVGSAIGDALGSSLEGFRSRDVNLKDLPFFGRWTDDTHMMIGVAESLVANRGFNGEHMAWTFVKNWEEEPWRGYGPGPPRVLRMIKLGVPWERAAGLLYGGAGSFGNGAAMRVAPVDLLYHDDPDKLRAVAYASAEITHTHELGKEEAAIQAFAVALAVEAEPQSFEATGFLKKLREFTENRVYRKNWKGLRRCWTKKTSARWHANSEMAWEPKTPFQQPSTALQKTTRGTPRPFHTQSAWAETPTPLRP